MNRFSLIAVVAACHPSPTTTGAATNVAIIYVASNVGAAQVYLDDRLVGPVSAFAKGIAVDPGAHRVELRHDDYFSRYAELALRRSQVARLELDMAPILP